MQALQSGVGIKPTTQEVQTLLNTTRNRTDHTAKKNILASDDILIKKILIRYLLSNKYKIIKPIFHLKTVYWREILLEFAY